MPDEILAIIIVSIAAITAITIIKTVLGYHERMGSGRKDHLETQKEKSKGSSEGASLTTTELERMVERAAASAVQPLREDLEVIVDRLDAMEDRVEPGVLDLDDEFDPEEDLRPKTKTMGGRVQ